MEVVEYTNAIEILFNLISFIPGALNNQNPSTIQSGAPHVAMDLDPDMSVPQTGHIGSVSSLAYGESEPDSGASPSPSPNPTLILTQKRRAGTPRSGRLSMDRWQNRTGPQRLC
ncbi:hypothetical protein B0H17DRAFT_655202 [Mycena rosella]|uniref:Uncharacterized protein n=1 Tax=Mycena rosella TaxID=1033263 RepID=A0AAD7DCL2_MYCRO|nr:hypothetical protein B0H17DRAFT_655202 [Mycena rosella]